MQLEILKGEFAVCKLPDLSEIDWKDPILFLGKTEQEISLVCDAGALPTNRTHCEMGWKGFRVQGSLDFSLIGVLAKISKILTDARVGIFAISTYNTDYILVKREQWNQTVDALTQEGYVFLGVEAL